MDRFKDFLRRVVDLYADGFRNMTIGRTLWALILVKVAVLFGVVRLFFFPDVLKRDFDSDSARADHVRTELTARSQPAPADSLPGQAGLQSD